MVFDEPSALIGFGFGFNDAERQSDGRLRGPVGWVTLYNEDERRIRTRPLFASRLLCCTEGEFEYVARQPEQRRLLVKRLVARITEDYTPFDPGTGQPGEGAMKFFGVDWVRYQRTEDVPECPPVDP
jgi:hypothetical protein